jgi:hypothetical protein
MRAKRNVLNRQPERRLRQIIRKNVDLVSRRKGTLDEFWQSLWML